MIHERDHARPHARPPEADVDLDLAPGQASLTADLRAPAAPLGSGLVPRVATVGYTGELATRCPSLPRRTANPVFAQLAAAYRDFELADQRYGDRRGGFAELLGYTPDLAKETAAIRGEAARPDSALHAQSLRVNDRRVQLMAVRQTALDSFTSLKRNGEAVMVHALIFEEQRKKFELQLTTLRQRQEAQAELTALGTAPKDLLGEIVDIAALGWGLVNLATGGLVKFGATLLFGETLGKSATGATADVLGQSVGGVVGFVDAAIENSGGRFGKRKQLTSMLEVFALAMAGREVELYALSMVHELVRLETLQRAALADYDRIKRVVSEYAQQQRAVAQVERDRETTVDARTGGKLGDVQQHIAQCRDLEAAATAIAGGPQNPGKAQPVIGALDAIAALPPARHGARPVEPRRRNPLVDLDPEVLPPRAPPLEPEREDPIAPALAGEARAMSGYMTGTIASAAITRARTRDKRAELAALAASTVAAAEVDDPRLP